MTQTRVDFINRGQRIKRVVGMVRETDGDDQQAVMTDRNLSVVMLVESKGQCFFRFPRSSWPDPISPSSKATLDSE